MERWLVPPRSAPAQASKIRTAGFCLLCPENYRYLFAKSRQLGPGTAFRAENLVKLGITFRRKP